MERLRIDSAAPARHDANGDPRFQMNAALRAEALRQLRWQRQEWARSLATHEPGTPYLVAATERARLNESLDLLREAGEDVPPRFYRRGSLQRMTDAAGGTTAGVSLASLLADIDRVLAWFEPEPSAQGPGVSVERRRPRTDADYRR